MMHRTDLIPIGELAARTGVAVSAIRFYEAKGLVEALRTGGGQRRFLRADIRRVSFILIAQQLGLSLEEIAAELTRLPAGRTPNGADWTRISTALRARIDGRSRRLNGRANCWAIASVAVASASRNAGCITAATRRRSAGRGRAICSATARARLPRSVEPVRARRSTAIKMRCYTTSSAVSRRSAGEVP